MGPWTRQFSGKEQAARVQPELSSGAMSRPFEPEGPDLSPTVAARRGLRTGWTTGTCASAAAKAAYLATGARSEAAAAALYPGLDPVCLIEVGDFAGIALRRAAHAGMRKVVFVGMAGKPAKLAAGVMMTHFHRSEVDTWLLGALALEAGAPRAVVEAATETTTARHFFDACMAHGCLAPLALLCERAGAACLAHAGSSFEVEVVLVDYEGSAALWRAGPEGSASGSA
jgi:cobalt-precorrin-5B (C1)-methyltransferase